MLSAPVLPKGQLPYACASPLVVSWGRYESYYLTPARSCTADSASRRRPRSSAPRPADELEPVIEGHWLSPSLRREHTTASALSGRPSSGQTNHTMLAITNPTSTTIAAADGSGVRVVGGVANAAFRCGVRPPPKCSTALAHGPWDGGLLGRMFVRSCSKPPSSRRRQPRDRGPRQPRAPCRPSASRTNRGIFLGTPVRPHCWAGWTLTCCDLDYSLRPTHDCVGSVTRHTW